MSVLYQRQTTQFEEYMENESATYTPNIWNCDMKIVQLKALCTPEFRKLFDTGLKVRGCNKTVCCIIALEFMYFLCIPRLKNLIARYVLHNHAVLH